MDHTRVYTCRNCGYFTPEKRCFVSLSGDRKSPFQLCDELNILSHPYFKPRD